MTTTINVADGGVVNVHTPTDMFKAAQRAKVSEALSADEVEVTLLKASGDEARFTLGLAYPALRPDAGVAADGFRDFVAADLLEKAAWGWMNKSGGAIGVGHQQGTDGRGRVVESYIHRSGDWAVGDTVIKNGDWLVGVVWDEATWPLVKSGELSGFSPQGDARRVTPSQERLAELRSN